MYSLDDLIGRLSDVAGQELDDAGLSVNGVDVAVRITAEVEIAVPAGWEIDNGYPAITIVREVEL